MTRSQIEQRLLEHLTSLPGWVRVEARGSIAEGLMTRRVLDSVGLLEFVSFVEELCGIEVPSEDITVDNFDSVDGLLRYLESKRAISEVPP